MTDESKKNQFNNLSVFNESAISKPYYEIVAEHLEQYRKLKETSQLLPTTIDKVRFWLLEKMKFQNSVDTHIKNVSGDAGKLLSYDGPLFLDQYILSELEYWQSILELEQNETEEILTIPTELKQRVAWCYAIGITDYLISIQKITSNNAIGEILGVGMGLEVKPNTIQKYIRQLSEPNSPELAKYSQWIDQRCLELKIIRVH